MLETRAPDLGEFHAEEIQFVRAEEDDPREEKGDGT
jgi:hypothetical protein